MSCGLYCGGNVRKARHVGTWCLREQRDGEKEEQVHAYKLTASGAPTVRAKPLSGHRDPLSSVDSERITGKPSPTDEVRVADDSLKISLIGDPRRREKSTP